MDLTTVGMVAFGVAFFLALLGLSHFGTVIGNRRLAIDPNCIRRTAASDGVLYALFGLLMAFTFSDASARFERRRDLIVSEANALSTAASRFDLLAEPKRGELRTLLGRYVEARLALTTPTPSRADLEARQPLVVERQTAVWATAIAACSESPNLPFVLLPPLNEAFDLGEVRRNVLYHSPPTVIFVMLLLLALAAAFFAGQSLAGSTNRLRFHRIAFTGVITLTACTIIDLELPRRGLIRMIDTDRLLVELVAALR
ncbi:MAG: hypothetical protein FJ293_03080 [Planctomycetes bacterium]|nr:hypothetical protein [Planctomycetota bacterium]